MAYDPQLAEKVRAYLKQFPNLATEEKRMFGGLAFLVDRKMCVNVSGNNMMCRFDPAMTGELTRKKGFLPMIMKRKELNGYCYVAPNGISNKKDFEFWMDLCLDFNIFSKSSKQARPTKK